MGLSPALVHDEAVAVVPARRDALLRWWLVATALAVVATIVIGGATRLTESGLSITEWKPVTGVLPPLTRSSWEAAYADYLKIPEAQTVHAGISLAQFQGLYWWEWAHRLVARVVGLVIVVPFLVFWWRGWIPRHLRARAISLPVLVLAQGALGWYMVSSGLAVRTSVSQYRLVAHLSLALLIFAIATWTAAELAPTRGPVTAATPRTRLAIRALVAGVVLTMMSGGFVAGLDAGRIFNEFPLMGGQVVPDGYRAMGVVRNAFENPIAAQFHHRVLAVTLAIVVLGSWLRVRRSWPPHVARWMGVAAAAVVVQVALGITTLLLGAPVGVSVLHQAGAVVVLGALLVGGANASRKPGG